MKIDFTEFREKNNLPDKGEKIVVAMSGGVDSSVAAILLLKAGYEVIGVTMQLHESKKNVNKSKTCCSGVDIADAKEVAKKYKFKHFIIDYQKEFKKSVIDDFIESYLSGETPIPCIRCNQTVKFTDLIKFTESTGSKFLATGHYVRRIFDGVKPSIYQARDNTKDQSYFLFATTPSQLKILRFPLGEFSKEKVRHLANFFGLNNADKPDSQDICFVPNGNYRDFIKQNTFEKLIKGNIENSNGDVLGKHNGITGYTVGQRKGIGIGGIKGENYHSPYYVIEIDKDNNKVIVGPREKLKKYKIYLKDINLINEDEDPVFNAEIKIRSGEKKIKANIKILDDKRNAIVELFSPEYGVAPGQACVFYKKEKVVGGGWIIAAEKNNGL